MVKALINVDFTLIKTVYIGSRGVTSVLMIGSLAEGSYGGVISKCLNI